jgi:hypothetical protein
MFVTIDYLLFSDKQAELDCEILENFKPYMVGRYMSFYDKNLTNYVNETINRYGHVFKDTDDQFKFYENVIPKLKKKRINYIKKATKDTERDSFPKSIPEFYSKREMRMLDMDEDFSK